MTNEEKRKLYAALSAPFGDDAIERTDGRVTGRGYDTAGIKYQYVVNRLNEVLGLGCWRTEQMVKVRETTTSKGRAAFDATCDITLQFGEWVEGKFVTWAQVFATGGHQSLSEADARKGAFTNGVKKAAAMCGCGKQAYEGTLDDDNVPAEGAARTEKQPRPAPRSPKAPPASHQPVVAPTEPAKAAPPASPARGRTTPKQLAVIWSCMRKLGIEEATFRRQVVTRFGAEPEDLGPKVASELIGQLTAKANGGSRGKAAA